MRYQPPPPRDTHTDLEQVRRQARDLRRAFRAGHSEATALVAAHYRNAEPHTFELSDAQLVIARLHGFESWPQLKAEMDRPTPAQLAEAIQAGNRRRARTLLRRRPELVHMERAADNEHRPLHYAVLRRDLEMVRLLMAAGADARRGIYPHREATTAYTLARERGYDEIVAAIEAGECERRDAAGCANPVLSPGHERLFQALRQGETGEVEALLESDPSLVYCTDREGSTPLNLAAAVLNADLTDRLLARSAPVDQPDFNGYTALDRAALAVHWRKPGTLERFRPVAERLRAAGAQLTPHSAVALAEDGWLRAAPPEQLRGSIRALEGGLISTAVQHNRPETVELLLDLGLDPDEATCLSELDEATPSRGMPLWHAAASGRHHLAELLLRRGADPNAMVYASGTPVSQAFGQRDERMIALLARYGGHPDAATAGLYRRTHLAREFLAGGSTVRPTLEETGPAGLRDLLWGGACGGDPEIVRLCLERIDWPRADPRWFEILDQPIRLWNHGPGHWVPSGAAALDRSTYLQCFRLVLERTEPNLVGRFGTTMLHRIAAAGVTWGQPVMTEAERVAFATLLLDAGARLDLRDDLLRSTPLGWAARWGRLELAQLLVARGAPVAEPEAEPWATPLAWAAKSGNRELADWLRNR